MMPVEAGKDGSPPAVVELLQTGLYVGANDIAAPTVEHVYVLADRVDNIEVYQYRQAASEATD